jgi:hypothetical protein
MLKTLAFLAFYFGTCATQLSLARGDILTMVFLKPSYRASKPSYEMQASRDPDSYRDSDKPVQLKYATH